MERSFTQKHGNQGDHSSRMLMLLVVVVCEITKVHSAGCKVISPGCSGDERNSATVECIQTMDNFADVVLQGDCFGVRQVFTSVSRGYPYYDVRKEFVRNKTPQEMLPAGFELSILLSHFDIYSVVLDDFSSMKTFIKMVTIDKGNSQVVPMILYDLEKVNNITINDNELQKINLNKFATMLNLMKLNVSYNSITVLEEYNDEFTTGSRWMQIIDLSHNLIENIPDNCFKHFNQLKHLNLSYNSLKNFDILTFEGVSQLETLDLSNNNLLQIGHNLARFVNLRELSLAHNDLDSIIEPNFKTMSYLEKLNISSNKLTKIEDNAFQGLLKLTELDLTNNNISVIRSSFFRNSTKLSLLYLSQNSIHFIEPGAFKGKNITSFLFDNNNLKGSIKQATFEGIYTNSFDLSGGMITSLESEVFPNSHINSLNLSSNLISSISKTSFKSMNNLTELDLSNNNISAIDFETTNLKNLVILDVRNNSLRKIIKGTFKNFTMLKKLDLSYNEISKVEPQSFVNMEKLENLYLMNNFLSNSLEENTFKGLPSLTDLQLSFMRIPSFENESFSGLNSLSILNSSHGELTSVEFNALKNTGSIEILDLSYNLLDNFLINTSCLPILERLYLNHNKIRNVTNDTFYGLTHLITLNLNHNNIFKLGPTVFLKLSNLQNFYLSSNGDVEINSIVFDNLTSLTDVFLSNDRKYISFENATSTTIRRLDLSSCQIKNANTIFIFNLHSLEKLNLSVNRITFIDQFTFQSMPDLFSIDLSFNLISFIQPGSFLKTNNIKSLNLHGNELPALQYGVLDGLNELQELNISSNALHSIEISVLHKTPHISTIALDDNALEDLKFHQFYNTTIKLISVGGNPISCEAFVALKKEGLNIINITAERLDYNSENVDGIRCRSASKFYKNVIWPNMNNTDINVTFAFVALKNAIQNFTLSIEKFVNKNEVQESDSKKNFTNILGSIDKHIIKILESVDKYIAKNDTTEIINNAYLSKFSNLMDQLMNNLTNSRSEDDVQIQTMTHSLNSSANNVKLIDSHVLEKIRMLNVEKEKIIVELKTMFQDLKKENSVSFHNDAQINERNNKVDNNGVLYVIAVCSTVNVIILLLFVYKFMKSGNRVLRNTNLHSSTQPIANVIEME